MPPHCREIEQEEAERTEDTILTSVCSAAFCSKNTGPYTERGGRRRLPTLTLFLSRPRERGQRLSLPILKSDTISKLVGVQSNSAGATSKLARSGQAVLAV